MIGPRQGKRTWWRSADRTLKRLERQERTALQRLQRYTPDELQAAMQRIMDEAKAEHPLWLNRPPMDTGALR